MTHASRDAGITPAGRLILWSWWRNRSRPWLPEWMPLAARSQDPPVACDAREGGWSWKPPIATGDLSIATALAAQPSDRRTLVGWAAQDRCSSACF